MREIKWEKAIGVKIKMERRWLVVGKDLREEDKVRRQRSERKRD